MTRVYLVHWKAAESAERAERLRSAGFEVDHRPPTPRMLRELRRGPPSAVVIDLSRLPSQGRDLAVALRSFKATRHVPLVFVDGDPQKVARIRQLLPDAAYTTWGRIRGSLGRAIAKPPRDPVSPGSGLGAYAGTPLIKKLGIKSGCSVTLVGAPTGFENELGTLPEDAAVRRHDRGRRDLTLWFARTRRELERRVDRMTRHAEHGGLWILWPKKTSGVRSDLSQSVVREVAMAAGIVDFKICSVDTTWSGLRFTRRKAQ
jgi:hypothetical protein